MSAIIIDGKEISKKLRLLIKDDVSQFVKEHRFTPGLSVVLVGDDPASQVYVRNKARACKYVGIHSEIIRLAEESSEEQLLNLIEELNNNQNVHGILVQLPLPKHFNSMAVLRAIDPKKDVDGFHIVNAGALFVGEKSLASCTPMGCIELIKSTGTTIEGKHAVVVGRSNIVGKPISMMLLSENATVTMCHSRTKNLKEITKQGDILVAAIGKPEFISGDMIKQGAVVIDVGINRVNDKLIGDVNFAQALKVASYITPVPGGVGPMTITMLLQNTLTAARSYV